MIIRVLSGRVPLAAAAAFAARLGDDVRVGAAQLDGLLGALLGLRDEVDHWAFVAISLWRDPAAIEAASADPAGPTRAFDRLRGLAEFDAAEHYEVEDEPRAGAGVSLAVGAGAIGIVRVRVDVADEAAAADLVRRQQHHLLATGDVRTLFVGRRLQQNGVDIVAVALWKDRDRMRTFLAERPEGPGLDPRFVALARRLRFETFDVLAPGEPLPALGVPAVFVFDVSRVFVEASAGVEPLMGMPAELLLGHRLDDYLTDEAGAHATDRWRSFLKAGRQEGQLTLVQPDGSRLPIQYVARANVPAPGLHAWLVLRPGAPRVHNPDGLIRAALDGRASTRSSAVARAAAEPTIICVPSRDRLFNRFVLASLAALETPSARRLQLHLRGLYPHAVVHRRELEREPASTWYVFRDRLLGGLGLPEEWWTDPSAARAEVDRGGRLVGVNQAMARIYGAPVASLVGRDLRTLGIPGLLDDLALLLRLAFEEGTTESTIRLMSRDGTPLDLAFRGEVDGETVRFAVAPLRDHGEPAEWFAPICLPTSDELFISRVEDLCSRLAPGNAAVRAAQLAARLHRFYPAAIVRSLGHVIGFGPGTHVLLVYRDGERSPYADQPWWEEPGVASATLLDGRYVDANDAALAVYGLSRDELIGSTPGQYLVGRADRVWLADILNRTGVLHSMATMRRPDGRVVELEYRVTRDVSDPRLIAVTLRTAPPLPGETAASASARPDEETRAHDAAPGERADKGAESSMGQLTV